jgi:NADH-quinone oxidoreductase subunit J
MTLPQFFFAYHATAITVLSLLVITRKNPVHSVLFMLLLFFNIASMYLFLNAEFIAAIQVIVYAGAILVLFLFVVFLLNIKEVATVRRYINQWPLAVTVAVMLFAAMAFSIKSFVAGPQGKYSVDFVQDAGHVEALGTVLYTEYIFPFEVASTVLLVGLIGAIVLAKKRLKS